MTLSCILDRLKKYAQSQILEPVVAGVIFTSMVKGVAVAQPEQTLDFFIPYLCSKIETIVNHATLYNSDNRKFDMMPSKLM